MGVDVGLMSAFLAGALSFLSPCILPLVPPYLCFLAGTSLDELVGHPQTATTTRAVSRAVAFVLGFGLIFVALGATATWIGQFVGDHLSVLGKVAGAVVLLFGLHMVGAFRWLLLNREARFQVEAKPAGLFGAFVVGLAFAFGWTPCVGPVLASILMLAGTGDTAAGGATLLAAYAAGIGLPFVLAAFFTGPFMQMLARFRRHLGTVEKVMGGALIATGLVMLAGAMPILGNWLVDVFPALGQIG